MLRRWLTGGFAVAAVWLTATQGTDTRSALRATARTAIAQDAPAHRDTLIARAAVLHRAGEFEQAVETLDRVVALDPSDPAALHLIATYFSEKAGDSQLSATARRALLERASTSAERALAIDPDHFEALVSRSVLLRTLSESATTQAERAALAGEADSARARALEVGRERAPSPSAETRVVAAASEPPLPPPPPPPPGHAPDDIEWVYGRVSTL